MEGRVEGGGRWRGRRIFESHYCSHYLKNPKPQAVLLLQKGSWKQLPWAREAGQSTTLHLLKHETPARLLSLETWGEDWSFLKLQ